MPQPSARPWLIVEELDDEVLVYDQRTHRAHALSGAAAWVFLHGRAGAPFAKGEVEDARDALEELGLAAPRDRRRRRFLVGAAAAFAVTILAPSPAQAISNCTNLTVCLPSNLNTPCLDLRSGKCGKCSALLQCNPNT